jgi:hypothetical protein
MRKPHDAFFGAFIYALTGLINSFADPDPRWIRIHVSNTDPYLGGNKKVHTNFEKNQLEDK